MTERDDRALRNVCPNCNAQPGKRCTQPDDNGRHEVTRPHWARLDLQDT